MNSTIVEMENVSFAYNGQTVLQDVNLTIAPEDFVAIIGPNGGGKTTLLKLLLGLLTPDTGCIRVLGDSPGEASHHIGYVRQDVHINRSFPISTLDVVLMRKDPPFDMEYVYTTYLLEQAAARGSLVVNRPAALRDANEKLYTAWFPEVCSPTLVSRSHKEFIDFVDSHQDVVMKPLAGMGGTSVFRVRADDPNRNVIIETLTDHQKTFAMAQRFIPEIRDGDKRILVVNGEAVPYCLARVPLAGENRGNLAAGGSGVAPFIYTLF